MKKNCLFAIIFAIACVSLLLACGGYKEGMRQPDQESYIWFSGNTAAAVATINNGEPIALDAPVADQEGNKTHDGKTFYRVKPGKHEILVKRNNQVIVNRVIIVGSGAEKEIAIP